MIEYRALSVSELSEYAQIPFRYVTRQRYALELVDRGRGGITLSLIDVPEYVHDFGSRAETWEERFDLRHWRFWAASDAGRLIAGATLACRTPNLFMLEGRDDLGLLLDIRVHPDYQRRHIGTQLFTRAVASAQELGLRELKVECQNTNPTAVNFYHHQGMKLGGIKTRAYPDYPDETQLLWYLDL